MRSGIPAEWEALITEKERYTFGELIEAAERVRKHPKEIEEKQGKRHIHWIQEPTIAHQLIQFLAYGDGNTVPVIAPSDVKISDELRDVTPPEGAYMGVMTSGTSGRQKVLFRSFESWHDFFNLQNKIFKMGEGSITFMRGAWRLRAPEPLYGAACVRRKRRCGGFLCPAPLEADDRGRTGDLRLSDSCQAAGAAAYL